MPPTHDALRGIEERRDAAGRLRYRVRVRRRGQQYAATLPSLEAALAWRARALAAAEGAGEPPERPLAAAPPAPPGRAATVEDAARRLCRGMKEGTVRARDGRPYKPSTTRHYEESLRLLIIPRLGSVPVAALSRGDVQRLADELAAAHSPPHAHKALTALRVAVRLAERYGEVEANPCSGVRTPAAADVAERPARVLAAAEAVALLTAAERDDSRLGRSFAAPLIALALGSGLRLGELLALRWGPEGLDLDAGVVRVRQSLDRHRDEGGAYPLVAPKSRASRRDVPLPPEDAARLRRHRLATGRPPDGALVFADDEGRPLAAHGRPRATWRRLVLGSDDRPALAALAAPAPRFHDLRHTFATHALAAGLSAHAVADLLGHSTAALVLARYGHALPGEVAGAGLALEEWRRAQGRRRRRKIAP